MGIQAVEDKYKLVETSLKAQSWFEKDGWQISTHPFPRNTPSGITFHMFKMHWYNEDSRGIHIESHLNLSPNKQKSAYLTVHLLHKEMIPGTKIKRIELSRAVVDAAYKTVAKWKGYKFRAGKYGQQPFALTIDGTSPEFETILAREVTRLCKVFGPLIDKTLSSLLRN